LSPKTRGKSQERRLAQYEERADFSLRAFGAAADLAMRAAECWGGALRELASGAGAPDARDRLLEVRAGARAARGAAGEFTEPADADADIFLEAMALERKRGADGISEERRRRLSRTAAKISLAGRRARKAGGALESVVREAGAALIAAGGGPEQTPPLLGPPGAPPPAKH
jgi:hypothetical protein